MPDFPGCRVRTLVRHLDQGETEKETRGKTASETYPEFAIRKIRSYFSVSSFACHGEILLLFGITVGGG